MKLFAIVEMFRDELAVESAVRLGGPSHKRGDKAGRRLKMLQGCSLGRSNLQKSAATSLGTHPSGAALPTSIRDRGVSVEDLFNSLTEVYSIIYILDGLENAYTKDVITELEYTERCLKLLKQYKSIFDDDLVLHKFNNGYYIRVVSDRASRRMV